MQRVEENVLDEEIEFYGKMFGIRGSGGNGEIKSYNFGEGRWLKVFHKGTSLNWISPDKIQKLKMHKETIIRLEIQEFSKKDLLKTQNDINKCDSKPIKSLYFRSKGEPYPKLKLGSFYPCLTKLASLATYSISINNIKLNKYQISCLFSCINSINDIELACCNITTENIRIAKHKVPKIQEVRFSHCMKNTNRVFTLEDLHNIFNMITSSFIKDHIQLLEFQNCEITEKEARMLNTQFGSIFTVNFHNAVLYKAARYTRRESSGCNIF
ncbi:unnamed protein product [Moneuplotes crassus]|uniref:Uncharacterized protein n=1 Tax=Euplotes crassus TaxID=5936 RepID=A0AAD2D2K5_EUPCR|nr:unnamed protein product [Moneuplotes crassus]